MNADVDFKQILSGYPFMRVIQEVSETLGMKIYLVGGRVRDFILERASSEFDFVVLGDGTLFAEAAAEKLNVSEVQTYKRFGTAHFRWQGYDLEFVGARKESYSENSRNPKVSAASFEEDIARRDFTINALAVSACGDDFGMLTDMYNGIEDLSVGIIRTPLDPIQTFSDDPLRIMRAFRFSAQLRFSLHPSVTQTASLLRERLSIVTQERITDEFLKILGAPKPSVGLIALYESGVLESIFPELSALAGVDQRKDYHHKDVFYHTCLVVDNISAVTENLWLRFAALVHDIAKPQTKKFVEGTGWTFHGHEEKGARMMNRFFRVYKLPHHHLEYVKNLVRLHLRPIALAKDGVTDSAIRRLIVEAGEYLDDLITLCRADITSKNPDKVTAYLKNYEEVMQKVKIVVEKDALRAFQSPVRGDEIMSICDLKPSRKVGEIKSAIEDAILEGIIPNTYEAAYEYMLTIKDSILQKES